MNDYFRIKKVANGWILYSERPEGQYLIMSDETYVFPTSKKLAKFIKKLDKKGNENEA